MEKKWFLLFLSVFFDSEKHTEEYLASNKRIFSNADLETKSFNNNNTAPTAILCHRRFRVFFKQNEIKHHQTLLKE